MTTYIRLVRDLEDDEEIIQIFTKKASLKVGRWLDISSDLIDHINALNDDISPTNINAWLKDRRVIWTKPFENFKDEHPECFL